MTLEDFRDLVSQVLSDVPEPLHPLRDRIEFDVSEGEADDELSHRERLDLEARGIWGAAAISRVTLRKAAFEAEARDHSRLRDLVRDELMWWITRSPEDDSDDELEEAPT